MDSKNEFKIDITVKQFLNKFFLLTLDWFYCYIEFPEEIEKLYNATWKCSEVIYPKTNRKKLDEFLYIYGNMNVFKVSIIKPGEGFYPNGENIEGLGMIIYIDYNKENT